MSETEDPDLPNSSPFRSGVTRQPMGRIQRIHEEVSRNRYPNCSTLSDLLKVSGKTIQRDIQFMRESLKLPIEYDKKRHGFFYTQPVNQLPMFQATAEDLVALVLAKNALSHLGDTPLVASLRATFEHIQEGLRGRVTIPWTDIDQAFSVHSGGVSPRDIRIFDKVSRAIMEERELRFEYTKLGADKSENRRLQPYHLAEIDGGWYVIGHDVDRKGRRTFATLRMRNLTLSKQRFARPADFRLEDHFAGSFGVWAHSDRETTADRDRRSNYRVRIRFRGFAARFVPERRWHPSQEIMRLDDNGDCIEMLMELSALEDITRWILSFGRLAEVIEPQELRDTIAREIKAMDRNYQ